MKAYRRSSQRGFTLVEILIVVIILGILAAIVIPQFTNASEDARKSNMTSQLQTLRSQIELYKLQHRDQVPDLLNGWNQFTMYTDDAGNTSATATPVFKFGPYVQSAPVNPLTGSSTVVAPGDVDENSGWTFNVDTGLLRGVNKDGVESETGDVVAQQSGN